MVSEEQKRRFLEAINKDCEMIVIMRVGEEMKTNVFRVFHNNGVLTTELRGDKPSFDFAALLYSSAVSYVENVGILDSIGKGVKDTKEE